MEHSNCLINIGCCNYYQSQRRNFLSDSWIEVMRMQRKASSTICSVRIQQVLKACLLRHASGRGTTATVSSVKEISWMESYTLCCQVWVFAHWIFFFFLKERHFNLARWFGVVIPKERQHQNHLGSVLTM